MYQYSVPADFRPESLDRYEELTAAYPDSRVTEVYGQMTKNNTWGSGRAVSDLRETGILELETYCAQLRERGMEFNYTLNGTCLGNRELERKGIREIRRFLKDIHAAGVTKLTLALPSLMEIALDLPEKFEIKASTLCQITTLNKALHYRNMGINRMVVDESRNRGFGFLRQMSSTVGDGVEVIVNVICNVDCPYRMFHYNEMAHNIKQENGDMAAEYYSHRCMEQRLQKPENILKMGWIRPEDLHYYHEAGIRHYKIQGRQAVGRGDLCGTVEAYFKKEYEGNLLLLLDAFAPTSAFLPHVENRLLEGYCAPFAAADDFCMHDCGRCGYCREFALEHLEYQEISEIGRKGMTYYLTSDQCRRAAREAVRGDENDRERACWNDNFAF